MQSKKWAHEQSNNSTSHHIPGENLKQLGLQNYWLVFANGCGVVWLASSKSQMQYSIILKFSGV